MLDQVLIALAASGGTAVVTAAGTDAWAGMRQAVARWFGRGDAQREQATLERLDQTVVVLQASDLSDAERTRIRQEEFWRDQIEGVLESLDEDERAQAAEQLRSLLAQHVGQGRAVAGPGGLAVGGNVAIHAESGAIAAGVINGGAHAAPPSIPDPHQG